MDMYTVHLFAGAGGGILADRLLGHTPIGACEIEEYPRKVLLQRQLDGILPVFPIWDDVTTLKIDNPECREIMQQWKSVRDNLCISGGFPCQDISAAGKGEGITGEKSGLWKEFARIICEIRPRFAFVENSPMLTVRGLGVILRDLAEMGYNARWGVLGADDVGCDHHRKRIWIYAYTSCLGVERRNGEGWRTCKTISWRQSSKVSCKDLGALQFDSNNNEDMPKPCLAGKENDVAYRVDRLKAIGNGQVPTVAKLAWETLSRGKF